MAWTPEEDAADEREHGVADPAVFPRHRARFDAAPTGGHPASHHEIRSTPELF
jgi:hypothetical protein